jgi:putative tricarboxylic transport membrane protein
MKDYIVGVSSLLLSGYVYLASRGFSQPGQNIAEDPAKYPRLLAAFFALMGAGLLIQTIHKRDKVKIAFNWELLGNIGMFLAVLIGYILLLQPAGFIISTALFTLLMIWLLGGTLKQGLIYTVPITAVVYVVFANLLKVPLPKGILPFI